MSATITAIEVGASLNRRGTATVNVIADDVCEALQITRTASATSRVRAILYQLEAAGDVQQVGWADRDGARQGRSAALWALRRGSRA